MTRATSDRFRAARDNRLLLLGRIESLQIELRLVRWWHRSLIVLIVLLLIALSACYYGGLHG